MYKKNRKILVAHWLADGLKGEGEKEERGIG
jgi:hypothetical protein